MNTSIVVLLSRKGSAVYSVTSSATVAEAVRMMNQRQIGSVVVLHAGQLEGIFTERDVLSRVVAAGRMPATTSVADVMTRNIITVSPHATVEEVMNIFTEKRCRHIPVVEEDTGVLVGMISSGDVMRWLVDSHRAEADHLRHYIAGSY
jgi:CBS domain-containing protein